MEKSMTRNNASNGRSCYKKLFILGILVAGIVTVCYFWNLKSSNTDLRGQINSEIFKRAEESKRVEAMSGHLRSCEEEAGRLKKLMQEKTASYEKLVAQDETLKKSASEITQKIEKLEAAQQDLEQSKKDAEQDAENTKMENNKINEDLSKCKAENTKLSQPKTCDKEVQANVNEDKQKMAASIQKILGDDALKKLIPHGLFEGIALPKLKTNTEAPVATHLPVASKSLLIEKGHIGAAEKGPSEVHPQQGEQASLVKEQHKGTLDEGDWGAVHREQQHKQQQQHGQQHEQHPAPGDDIEDEIKHELHDNAEHQGEGHEPHNVAPDAHHGHEHLDHNELGHIIPPPKSFEDKENADDNEDEDANNPAHDNAAADDNNDIRSRADHDDANHDDAGHDNADHDDPDHDEADHFNADQGDDPYPVKMEE